MIDQELKKRALEPAAKGDPAPREKVLKVGKMITDVIEHKLGKVTSEDAEYWAAFRQAKEVYADEGADANGGLFGLGAPNTAYAQYFTGESFFNPLTDPTKTVFLANVTFSPACRNNWHIHHAKSGGGQLLLCMDGLGWYQEAGKSAQALHPGDVVTIPAGVKHWHGAQKDCWFSHIAVECPGEETSNEWCEPVTDAEYAALDADCAQNP